MKDSNMNRSQSKVPAELLEVMAVIEGNESVEMEVLLEGEDRFHLHRELVPGKLVPGQYAVVAERISAFATFGGYWRSRCTSSFIVDDSQSRSESNYVAGESDWDFRQKDIHRRALETRAYLVKWLGWWLAAKKNTARILGCDHADAWRRHNEVLQRADIGDVKAGRIRFEAVPDDTIDLVTKQRQQDKHEMSDIVDGYLKKQKLGAIWATMPGPSLLFHSAKPSELAKDEAARLFLTLIQHKLSRRLARCSNSQCSRIHCDRIYLARTNKVTKNMYCSDECRNNDKANRPSVKALESKKLAWVNDQLSRMSDTEKDWKKWIIGQGAVADDSIFAIAIEVKKNWLTRRFNQRKITIPISKGA